MNQRKLRIAWFSPIEQIGQFSKSAYVSSTLLPELDKYAEVDLFSSKSGEILGGFVSKNFLTAHLQHKTNPYDYFFYNFENGVFCNFIRIQLGLEPGVTWFHDYTLIDDGPEPILNSPWTRILDKADNPEVKWPIKEDQFIPKRPQAFRECGMSLFSIFSSERDLQTFRSLDPKRFNQSDEGVYIPMPTTFSEDDFLINKNRPLSNSLIVASCQRPNVDNHVHSLLQAIKKYTIESKHRKPKLLWMVESGEENKARELLQEFEVSDFELVIGRNVENWQKILRDSNLSVNFLYSFYDQLQPWLNIALSRGVPTAVLNFSESQFLPDSAVFKISTGPAEVFELVALMNLIEERGGGINLQAKEYARETYCTKTIAAEIFKYLSSRIDQKRTLSQKLNNLRTLAGKEVLAVESASYLRVSPYTEIFFELGWK